MKWLSQLGQLYKHIINQSDLCFEAGFLLHVIARSDEVCLQSSLASCVVCVVYTGH